ncbi:hypothetical protein GGX14DRAFT_568753 [Mycena pura]|uniref:Uncharacterized protein n=1 Tax=Mycena pura TaxID=153505 RepID=A0AAD6YAC4_9AGAR|nr:hypothetical protein GGX14DRAFT_568753 [Mycena pura]
MALTTPHSAKSLHSPCLAPQRKKTAAPTIINIVLTLTNIIRQPTSILVCRSSYAGSAAQELDHEKKKRRKAERRALKTSSAANASSAEDDNSSVPDGSIARPKCPSKEKMCVIREHLGFDKLKWNAFLLCIQQALAARLDWKKDWRSQDSDRLRRAYDAVKEEYPEARRFRGSMGIDRVAKHYWDAARATSATSRTSTRIASTSTAAPRGPRVRPSRVVSDSDEEEDGDGQNEIQAAGD